MKGELALEQIGALIVVMIMTGIGLQIISNLQQEASETEINLETVYPGIDYPYCSDYETGQEIDREEFYKITYYRLKGTCDLEEQEVTSDFTLEKNMIESKAREWGLEDSSGELLLFYRDDCSSAESLELTGLTFGKQESDIMYRPGEKISFTGIGEEVIIC